MEKLESGGGAIVPSLREDLVRVAWEAGMGIEFEKYLLPVMLPLFAARVAAIEEENETLRVNAEKLFNRGIDHFNRAARLDAELIEFTGVLDRIKAERDDARGKLADAWDEGYDAPREKRWLGPSGSNAIISSLLPRRNPYRAGEGTPAGGGE